MIDLPDSHKHIGAYHPPDDPKQHLKNVNKVGKLMWKSYCKVIPDDHDPGQRAVEIRKDGSVCSLLWCSVNDRVSNSFTSIKINIPRRLLIVSK